MTKKLLFSLLLLIGGVGTSFAQEAVYKERTKIEKTDNEVLNLFRGLTIGGLVQAQWQMAQKKGMEGGGGATQFSEGSDNRFMLRRGYLKVAYESKYFASTVQINATADGVSLVNAFAQINTESKSAAFRMGHIYKPFGYFVSYPSGSRLAPEVSRGELTLFPDATGGGARLMLRNTKDHWTRDFAIDLCYFNGSMVGTDHFASQDFIGKLEYVRQINKRVMLGAQFSILRGSMVNMTDTYYSFNEYDTKFTTNSDVKGSRLSKSYYSLGATIGFKSIIGETKITGEYITGNQLSLANDNITPTRKFVPTDDSNLYNRKFTNYYIFLQHQIAKTNLSVIARYDSIDPNREIDGSDIGLYSGTTTSDLRYNTFGFGLYYKFFKYMSASAYYDIVNNEKTTGINGYDINRKNNLLTLRLQCFF